MAKHDDHKVWVNSREERIVYTVVKPSQQKPKGVILFHNGYSEHIIRNQNVYDELAKHGWIVYSYDASSHGQSDPQPPNHLKITDIMHLVHDLLDFNKQIVMQCQEVKQGLPRLAMANSLGALVTLLATTIEQELVQAAVFVAPALGVKKTAILHLQYAAKDLLMMTVPHARIIPAAPVESCARDPANREACRQDKIMDPGPIRVCTADSVIQGQQLLSELAPKISIPFKVIQGGQDHIVDIESTVSFMCKVSSKNPGLEILTKSWHDLLHDAEYPEVIAKASDYFDEILISMNGDSGSGLGLGKKQSFKDFEPIKQARRRLNQV